ncbi:hypothetical protein GCM10010182_04470 [Actinomadura cremea]|nr:hypothetical protein GCM10010182_04470 [Actinomadura cremea]
MVVDGHTSTSVLGHNPDPLAERHGDVVRLIVDAERDLIAFHGLAASRAERYIPAHAVPLTAALARALDVLPRGHLRPAECTGDFLASAPAVQGPSGGSSRHGAR